MDHQKPQVIRFNTTLVQLKEETKRILAEEKNSFNTTLVQLKDSIACPTGSPRCGFQYHTGSIKSLAQIAHKLLSWASFNTTLVQLKVPPSEF